MFDWNCAASVCFAYLSDVEHASDLVKDSRTSTYMNQGRWEEAKQLELQVIETTERMLGAEHLGTLASNQVNGEKDKHVQSPEKASNRGAAWLIRTVDAGIVGHSSIVLAEVVGLHVVEIGRIIA